MKKRLALAIIMLSTVNYQLSIAQDSLDIKIGQMILIGFPKAEVDKTVLEEIRQGKVGSIIIFEKNIPPKNSYHALKKITWTYQQAASIPLLIAIDQEGGRVNRLKEKYGFPRSVTAAQLGKMPLDSVRFYSESTAATLAGLGINLNFAPVVDLASNPNNPIIAKVERAYSANPDSVALYAKEVIKAHRKVGVITTLKHFPGHGSSKDDTHLGIADVSNTWNEAELVPYRALIQQGYVDAIMTAHIVNKKLDDSGNPGTLSGKMINDLLRKKLNYKGVVFSDDMQMHAIAKHYGLEEAIKLSILAGVDILTFSNNISGSQERTVDVVHRIIRKFVQDGTIPQERIDQSYNRILALKRKLSQTSAEYYREQLAETKKEVLKAEEISRDNVRRAMESEKSAQEAYEKLKEQQPKSKKKKKN
ncbi:MAG: glycoside hydrolase family 3 protein [Cyclobacteriaceae bacterium]|nr:glycoside hydrolase family 3 protein [Cyclobacteriaceae bacterium]UYN86799.1 MAG: glycoside hydrolase family 3 protein [Cyclobacteriaceae bacterium]